MNSLVEKGLYVTLMITGTLLSTTCLAKQYKVPGSSAVSVAKTHGYLFKSDTLAKRFLDLRPDRCKFVGMHWQVRAQSGCEIYGFTLPKNKKNSKCSTLRAGWKIVDVKLKGSYVWKRRPADTNNPLFIADAHNTASSMKPLTIDWVILEGPDGPLNKWQEAFSHCSDPNYRVLPSRGRPM